MRLLIVEDEPIVRELLMEVLHDEADELVVAGGVAEARALGRAGFTVALVDKNLPDGSGLALISELHGFVPDAAILLMTAYATLDTAIEALRAGAYDYVTKPFSSMHDLVHKVRRAREKVELTRHREALFLQVSENEARFRGLFESSADAIVVYDQVDGLIHEVNAAACTLYGRPRPELVGCQAATLHVASGDGAERVDRRLDGTTFPVEASRSLFPWQGRLLTVEIIRDRSEAVRAESERQRLTTQLQDAVRMESLGRMAGGIAHDFNNTLAVISTTSEMVAAELPAEVRQRFGDDFATIATAVQSAATLIRQLLTFSRREPARSDRLDLNEVIGGIDRLLRGTLRQGHDLHLVRAEEPCLVVADRGQLEQVLMNLVINARDALDGGGAITVTTLRHAHTVELVVSDAGCGIPEEIQQRIFEPFFTTKPVGQGTGLGLATVYGVVQGLGGTVELESKVGVGTTFRLRFPGVTTASAAIGPEVTRPITARTRVLVAEDDDVIRRIVCRMLQRAGFETHQAPAGDEALLLARGLDGVDLLLTDVVMPRMTGPQLATQLQRDQPGLPVIYMSGACPVGSDAALSPDRFLAKPFSEGQLLNLVRTVLQAP